MKDAIKILETKAAKAVSGGKPAPKAPKKK
jgi:hypothetical protein